MKAIDIFKKLDKYFPVSVSRSACESLGFYDNSGYLVETEDEITGVVFSLDLSEKAIKTAKELGYNLIVTHHPCIYSPIKRLSGENHAVQAAKSGIAVISMHLNMDFSSGGVCDSLTELCGGVYDDGVPPLERVDGGAYGRVAKVEPCAFGEFAEKVKKALGARAVRVYNYCDNVNKILCLCGAGLDEKAAVFAKEVGADVVVTSEAKHHIVTILKDEKISLVELTHYASEWEPFKTALQREFVKMLSLPFAFAEEEDLL